MGTVLTDTQVKDMLAKKKILLKSLKSKAGKPYDVFIIPTGTETLSLYQRWRKKRNAISIYSAISKEKIF